MLRKCFQRTLIDFWYELDVKFVDENMVKMVVVVVPSGCGCIKLVVVVVVTNWWLLPKLFVVVVVVVVLGKFWENIVNDF